MALEAQCPHCVDAGFCRIWLRRLADNRPGMMARAVEALSQVVASTPVCSAKVERKHLLGQEVRTARSRGLAAAPEELSKRTYQRSVSNANAIKSDLVFRDVAHGVSAATLNRILAGQAVERRGVVDAEREVARLCASRRCGPTRTNAWAEFRRLNWDASVRPGTADARVEMRRLRDQWSGANEQTRDTMAALADTRRDERFESVSEGE